MNSKGSSCMWIFSDKCIQYYKIWGWLNLRMWNLGYGSPANGLGYLQTLVSWADSGTSPHGCWGTAVLSKHSGSSCCLLDTLMYSLSLFLMNNLGVFLSSFWSTAMLSEREFLGELCPTCAQLSPCWHGCSRNLVPVSCVAGCGYHFCLWQVLRCSPVLVTILQDLCSCQRCGGHQQWGQDFS